jgi:glycolate oxidase FAD binding subunit
MTQVTVPIGARLSELVGPGRVVTEAGSLAAYEIDGLRPSSALRPSSSAEIADILRLAAAEHLAVIPMAGRTKLRIGMPPRKYNLALDLSEMNRVLAYDPQDLTLSVEPGARFVDVESQLAERGQFLPLAPAFADRATLGGMVAAGADTPLRYGYGTSRDCLLGLEFVTGEGIASKSGGRVVKNVTGYDLHKFLIGSLGTLAVITRLNFRTYPLPPERQMFVASFPEAQAALDFCAAIARSPLRPHLLDIVGPRTALLFGETTPARVPPEYWSVVIEAAGHRAVVERHARDLDRLAREAHAAEFMALDESQGMALFAAIREFPSLVAEHHPDAAIFRTPSLPGQMLAALQRAWAAARGGDLHIATLIRAAGVVYTAFLPPKNEASSAMLLAACRELMESGVPVGVQPMIEWCPREVKAAINVWPAPGSEQTLAQRLKNVFDPHRMLSPGRFQGGI